MTTSDTPTQHDEAERLAALRLARSSAVGPTTYRNLLARFGTAVAAIEALPALAKSNARAAQIRLCSGDDAMREMAQADAIGVHLIILGEPNYPELLAHTDPPPPILFVRGSIACLQRSMISIVGARNASGNGRRFAETIASALGARGHIVVSGLARGIDAMAHQGALATGTVAVLAGGIDQIYPTEHTQLAEAICENGALISEMPFGHTARAADFPRRNRLIAGLARGTIVVEAALRSGSLITARIAAEFGREVFAVPGSPLDARCRGTNQLIKDGAALTESIEDIEANLPQAPMAPPRERHSPTLPFMEEASSQHLVPQPADETDATHEPAESKDLPACIIELLGPSPISVDEVVRMTGARASEVQAALFDLELQEITQRHPGQMVSLTATR